jgi:hypothetical protein
MARKTAETPSPPEPHHTKTPYPPENCNTGAPPPNPTGVGKATQYNRSKKGKTKTGEQENDGGTRRSHHRLTRRTTKNPAPGKQHRGTNRSKLKTEERDRTKKINGRKTEKLKPKTQGRNRKGRKEKQYRSENDGAEGKPPPRCTTTTASLHFEEKCLDLREKESRSEV